jgi:NAD(P)-dependent dehydrogenase (short-subunit alcohol dehydrogenase family)
LNEQGQKYGFIHHIWGMSHKSIAVVTGAGRGIGRAVVLRLAQGGCSVLFTARTKSELDSLKLELELLYPQQHFACAPFDLGNRSDVARCTDWIRSEAGDRLDILVHNAGLFLPGSLLDEPDDQFLSILEVNVLSAYYLTRGLTELIKASRGAHLFFMCSTASIKAYPAGGAYAVSKHALLGLSRSLRQELMPFGVGVTSILPGPTYTSSWAGSGIPQDRFMRAEDIAELLWASWKVGATSVVEELLLRPILGDI